MIFLVGDTHGFYDVEALNSIAKDYPSITKNDFVIVLGDFGGCWDKQTLLKTKKQMRKYKFSILFIDGNHENFDILNSFPIEIWNGGRIHRLFDDVFHLMRGEVFTIEGKSFLTIGGAESIDKCYRRNHISWWMEESITDLDIENACKNLDKYDNKVDYVLSHTLPSSMLYKEPFYHMTLGIPKQSELELENLYKIVKFKKWFFGHWHDDVSLSNEFYCLYNKYYAIKD